MDLAARYRFDAPPSRVWEMLMDTDAIAANLPGCKGLREVGPDRYEAELTAGVAAVSGDFKATVTLQDKDPPHAYTLGIEATGRPGFVRGQARVTLTPDGTGTRVDIAGTANVGGLIARVGQRLLEGVARMSMDRFFEGLGGFAASP
jgi:carbon monoxide dehydrogenase subunit G